MKVSLIGITEPLFIPYTEELTKYEAYLAVIGRVSISGKSVLDIKDLSEKKLKSTLRTLIKLEHFSVFEHLSFTFFVEDLSRVASHQLVRHRIASYTQQSLRYTKAHNYYYPTNKYDETLESIMEEHMFYSFTLYRELIERGVKKEDARYVLPMATTSNIVITMNLREIIHFIRLRLSVHAQEEIRILAYKMFKILLDYIPFIIHNMFDIQGIEELMSNI